jgi:hypothetical protein
MITAVLILAALCLLVATEPTEAQPVRVRPPSRLPGRTDLDRRP